ncbi:winged helix-turn-helix transcriptional regulator [Mycolicibacterium rhodesiae]|uniref:winged helix-turn-helix transcriptional regulator n=1 Tax=Mycolicibacterium rhodesiae TaxID=36814 RepID=UPI0009F6519A|nr:helix-turn-helix domain-containing protein [Mycolicibacterium rhodesiae]MCV7343229.1 helix-turn-helix transcriptional regulator [Mycolicibacterium rhodesiae]
MRNSLGTDNCPAGRALDVIGERWSLLIVREALGGAARFDDFRNRLPISDNTLTRRLAELVERQILERRPYQSEPTRYEYRLTDRGKSLVTVLASLAEWGDRWTAPNPAGPTPPPVPSWLTAADEECDATHA